MLPLRIKVQNFGAIPAVEIDLAGISLASIVGKNGFGKSTLFTWAPLYCLFGKTKNGCAVDDLVKTGQQDMLVQFDFEHQGEIYQATRTRSLKGKGKSTLEFQKLVSGRYESLSGATITETEKKIQTLLNLDANTFISSSMILQNDSANFTQKPPGERKAILTNILGLSIYDQLQQAAREKEKALTIQLETSKNKLADLEEKLQALPEVEQQTKEIRTSITLNALSIREKETALSDAQTQVKSLDSKEQQAIAVKKQMDDICLAIAGITTEISGLNSKIGNAEIILEVEPTILTKVTELEEVKSKIPSLQAKEDRIRQLKIDGKKLTDEGLSLIAERDELRRKIAVLEHDLSTRDELKIASDDYQQGLINLKAMDEKADQWQSLQNQIIEIEKITDKLAEPIHGLQLHLKAYQTDLEANQKKLEILQNSGCPNPDNATCRFLQDAMTAKKMIPMLEANIKSKQEAIEQIELQLVPLTDKVADLDKQQYDLQYHATQHINIKKTVEALRLKAESYSQLAGKEELLQNLKEQRESIANRSNAAEQSVEKIMLEIEQLEEEVKDLPTLQASIKELEKYVTMKERLPEARTTIQLSQESIVKLQTEIDQKNEKHIQLLSDYTTLSAEFAGLLPDAREKVEAISGELKVLSVNQNNLYADQGTIKAKHEALVKDGEEKDRLLAELAPKAKELTRWQLLVKAFGKNGVPALIIENAIPELERISNDILSQMSNGAHSLRFETQRDLKSKDGVAETLDIIVSDWAGSRPYETYSGGEQLRIDLAIRFALAELLANRAGSKVEFIVADEIFGSQDTEHRELVIEAIKAVSNRFRMILVISHIAEAQAAFDQQIVLSEGGQVEVIFN